MESTMTALLPTFIVGAIFGALPLAVGIAVGAWLMRRQEEVLPGDKLDAEHAQELVRGLFQWTNNFAGDVGELRTRVEEIGTHIGEISGNDKDQDGVAAATVELLGQMYEANDRLQRRLDEAESTLIQQSHEIDEYFAEARTDALTGLPNRRAFDDELTRRAAEWRRYGARFSLLLIDVDHFKQFNDTHGHSAGDEVLRGVGRVVRAAMRDTDVVTRFGGEEYALVLPSTDDQQGRVAAERARSTVAATTFTYDSMPLQVTISCGLAEVLPEEDPLSLLKRADAALYASKDAGRDCGHFHDGKSCRPITIEDGCVETASPPSESPGASNTPSRPTGELGDLCEDLRRKLVEVIHQE